ncbi:MAG: hypothetical protein WDO71_02075 [Bacteroidota bacterium]
MYRLKVILLYWKELMRLRKYCFDKNNPAKVIERMDTYFMKPEKGL